METNVVTFLACICFLFIMGRIFVIPIRWILKLVFNSLLGAVIIFIINLIGGMWNFHIGINIITCITVGILGIPGAICLVVITLLL